MTDYTPPTAGDLFARAQGYLNEIAGTLGLEPPRWRPHEFVTGVAVAIAQVGGLVVQVAASVRDAFDPNQISGENLIRAADLAGVSVFKGTSSTALVTITAWTRGAVEVPTGYRVRNTATGTEWEVVEGGKIASGGSATFTLRCLTPGPVIAPANTLTDRISSSPGIVSVTNPAAAVPGQEADTSDIIRTKIGRGAGSKGSQSEVALRKHIESLPGVSRVRTYYNDKFTPVTVSGVEIGPLEVALWVFPNTITDEVKVQILQVVLSRAGAFTTYTVPETTGELGFVADALDEDGNSYALGAWWITSMMFAPSSIH